ncbi:Gag-Pol polyprotein, partial [Nosema granulosis]
AGEIARAVEELIIARHGVPERILSDCGLEFNNLVTTDLAKKHGFQWEFSSPFHHQTTGAVERVIQTLMQKVKKLTEFGAKRWCEYVAASTLAVNMSYNRAIGTSPFVVKKGRLPELDIDKELLQPRIFVSFKQSQDRKKTIMKKYRQQIIKGKILNKKCFEVGDQVLVFRKTQNKMDPDWTPGYVIKEKISEEAYVVRKGEKTIRVNKSHLRLE